MNLKTEQKSPFSAYDDALVYAASKGDFNIVKCLIDNGTKISRQNDISLQLSAHNGHLDICKYLIEFGIDRSRIKTEVFKFWIDSALVFVKDSDANAVEFRKYLNGLLYNAKL